MTAPAVISREQFTPEWIALVREIVVREGRALRAAVGPIGPTIEVKSLVTNEWHPLLLEGSVRAFATPDDRDAVLRALQGEA